MPPLVPSGRRTHLGSIETIVGYHASHEQFAPSALLDYVQRADAAGFVAGSNSDHFNPWTESQGQSGFAWSWMGAALARTKLRSLGVVNAPGQRYHPAIIAQALGTLGEMFPGRVWAALGSGQLLNEHITGERWPAKHERNARLKECVDIIRALLDGETVNHRGLVVVEDARLYTRPKTPPMLVGAAVTDVTAEWVGSWADALITVSRPPEQLKKVVDAFRRGGGEGKPMFLKVQLSYAQDDAEALRGAHQQWAGNILESRITTDLPAPRHFDAVAAVVQPDELHGHVRISADLGRHVEWLAKDVELGFSHLLLHNVNRGQERFIDDFGAKVLPQLMR